jgi:hypothetical protein
MSGAPHRGKLAQVARAAGRDAVRKLGCRAAPQMHVLDLDIADGPSRRRQQQVDPASLAIGHFAAAVGVAGELGNAAQGQGFGGKPVGPAGIDADEVVAARHQLPRPGEPAPAVRAGQKPDLEPRLGQAEHSAGIGTVGRDLGPVREADIGEKALVAPQQDAADERAGKEHRKVVSYQLSVR